MTKSPDPSSSVSAPDHPGLSRELEISAAARRKLRLDRLAGLAHRWHRARRAALAAVIPAPIGAAVGDDELLSRALTANPEAAQRRVFEHSLRLGQGFARFHRATIPLDELPAALAQIADGAPCLAGRWARVADEPALRLERAGCPAGALGRAACDWWREAVSGLVLGLTAGLRHARHDSRGHGAERCVDVIHARPESPLRFGPIPAELRDGLAAVTRTIAIFDSSLAVTFLGLSEGVLYYEVVTSSCVTGKPRAQPLVERGIRRRYPDLVLCEVSPRPVLEDP